MEHAKSENISKACSVENQAFQYRTKLDLVLAYYFLQQILQIKFLCNSPGLIVNMFVNFPYYYGFITQSTAT